MATVSKTASKKKKIVKVIPGVRISVFSSFNNTIITASNNATGDVIATSSSGKVGFKGAKKGTPYAATLATKDVLEKIAPNQPEEFFLGVSGVGSGRDAALRAVSASGIRIVSIHDTTPLPHNGCRAKKARRV